MSGPARLEHLHFLHAEPGMDDEYEWACPDFVAPPQNGLPHLA